MDDCDKIMTPGLAQVSFMSICNDFDETVTYGKDMYHGRIIDDFSITIDSSTVDNHASTLGIGTNDLENDTCDHTDLFSYQTE